MSITMLNILKIFLVVVGIFSTLWGVYDMFGDSGSQSSVGIKKIIGGIAFACIAFFVMDWAVKEVEKAESEAGITSTSVIAITESYAIEQPDQIWVA